MNRQEFLEFLKIDNIGNYKARESYIRKNFLEIYHNINTYCQSYDINFSGFSEKLWFYLYEQTDRKKCMVCGKPLKIEKEQSNYCSRDCVKKDKNNIVQKRQSTCILKYGSPGPLSAPGAKEQKMQTNLSRYGVEHALQNKEILDKVKSNNIQKYGVENVSKIPEVQQKISDVLKKSYNLFGDEITDKKRLTNEKHTGEYTTTTTHNIRKGRNTIRQKYGVDSPFKIHSDTYQKAKEGSIEFFSDENNKNASIEKRTKTLLKPENIEKYNKNMIARFLKKYQITDTILSYKNSMYKCQCTHGHIYEIHRNILNRRAAQNITTCIECMPLLHNGTSLAETEIYNWLKPYFPDIQRNVYGLAKKYELDIYIPSLKFGIEYNGVYWHSDLYKEKDYHQKKLMAFKDEGINVYTIWEDLWILKQDIYKSMLLNKLHLNDKKNSIFARNTKFKEIYDQVQIKEFLQNNHLQGYSQYSNAFGLMYGDEIVSLITIGKRSITKGNNKDIEILRFCNRKDTHIQGSFGKLFSHIQKLHPSETFKSYHNLDYGYDSFYDKVGFQLSGTTIPNYYYIIKGERHHRYKFRKDRLVKLGFDKSKTEFQIMDENFQFLRIYDNGNLIYTL